MSNKPTQIVAGEDALEIINKAIELPERLYSDQHLRSRTYNIRKWVPVIEDGDVITIACIIEPLEPLQ